MIAMFVKEKKEGRGTVERNKGRKKKGKEKKKKIGYLPLYSMSPTGNLMF